VARAATGWKGRRQAGRGRDRVADLAGKEVPVGLLRFLVDLRDGTHQVLDRALLPHRLLVALDVCGTQGEAGQAKSRVNAFLLINKDLRGTQSGQNRGRELWPCSPAMWRQQQARAWIQGSEFKVWRTEDGGAAGQEALEVELDELLHDLGLHP